MLKKQQRLTVAAFDHYFKIGRRWHGEYLQLIYTATDSFHGAVVVGKKVYKNAVDRNRLRRRLYGVLYQSQKVSPVFGVYLILVKPGAQKQPYQTIQQELCTLLAKLSIKQVQ